MVATEKLATNWLNEELVVKVEKIANLGYGLARHEGRVIFIRDVILGEEVRIVINVDKGKKFCFGKVIDIISASEYRISPRCEVKALGGGCCTFAHIESSQVKLLKEQLINEVFTKKLFHEKKVKLESLQTADTNWRTRVRFHTDESGKLGSFKAESHELITSTLNCIQPVLGLTEDLLEEKFLPNIAVQVVVDDENKRFVVAADRKNAGKAHKIIGDKLVAVNPKNFWQPHQKASIEYEKLLIKILDKILSDTSIKTAWDLYTGNGNFAYILAKNIPNIRAVYGVEYSKESIENAKINFKDIPVLKFITGAVENKITGLPKPDLVVLDPPRAGISKQLYKSLCAVKPNNIVIFGCDLENFVRDVNRFREADYSLMELYSFDAFPVTYHTESVAWLELNN